ncbi:N-6 DNA methylase [Chloroflexota bacterium]
MALEIAIYVYQCYIIWSTIGDTMNLVDKDVKKLANLNIDKYVRKASGACEENVKIKIVIPLLNLLGYSTQQDMDFEHHVQNKKADIALLSDNKPKLLVETKDLDEQLDNHINQGLNYAYYKGIEWVMLTNGSEIRIYKSFIPGISNPKDRLLFETALQKLPESFDNLLELVGKEHLQEAKKLSEKADGVRENITAKILIDDLTRCRERLVSDLLAQFKTRYETDNEFEDIIDTWASDVKMDVSDPDMIDKLCREGAYTLINRVLFLRICEDKGHIKSKLSKDAITKWRQMVEKPSKLLSLAFSEIGERFEGLYKSPLFDSIRFEDIDWKTDSINFVLDKLGEHDFSKISKDVLGKAYEQHISREERKKLGQFYTPDGLIDYILNVVGISLDKKILDPACGSGGFLIKSYDRLKKQYIEQGWDEKVRHKPIRNPINGDESSAEGFRPSNKQNKRCRRE